MSSLSEEASDRHRPALAVVISKEEEEEDNRDARAACTAVKRENRTG